MTMVRPAPGESFEAVLRRFRRAFLQAGIIGELRSREGYIRPGERRRKKHRAAVMRKAKARPRWGR